MTTCIYKVRMALAILGLMTIVLSSVLYVFAIFTPTTHIELLITRKYPDGTIKTITVSPSPLQIVEGNSEVTYTENITVYLVWAIEPEDWKPTTNIEFTATRKIANEETKEVIHQKTLATQKIVITAENGNKTPIYNIGEITAQDLKTAFGTKTLQEGTYQLTLAFLVKFVAKDPTGTLHNFTQSLTYTKTYKIAPTPSGGGGEATQQPEASAGGGGGGASGGTTTTSETTTTTSGGTTTTSGGEGGGGETTVYDIGATFTYAQLIPKLETTSKEPLEYSFTVKAEGLYFQATLLAIVGVASILSGFLSSIPRKICQI